MLSHPDPASAQCRTQLAPFAGPLSAERYIIKSSLLSARTLIQPTMTSRVDIYV